MAADANVDPSQLSYPSGAGRLASDPGANGGTALVLDGSGAAVTTVNSPQDLTRVVARVRGDGCIGPPSITLAVDGEPVFSGYVNNTSYSEVGGDAGGQAGAHTLAVTLNNPYAMPLLGCQRRLWVGGLTVYGQPFAPHSFVNTPLAADAPLDPRSASMVGDLVRQVNGHSAWVNTTGYGVPVYTVPAGQPTTAVEPTTSVSPDLRTQWRAVPLPPNAQPSSGSDHQLCVYQPSTDTLWEFEGLQRGLLGQWTAFWGGRMTNVSANPGYFVDPPGSQYGATATAISLLAGLQRIGELRAGAIHHTVAFTLPEPRNAFRWPAQRMDHGLTNFSSNPIPEGTIFRLPASMDVSALGLSPYARMLARAVQSYGMVVRDRGDAVAFAAEDPSPTGTDPYGGPRGIFGGELPDGNGALARFPWDRLQVVAVPARATAAPRMAAQESPSRAARRKRHP
jgi:hypothetical protein